MRRRFPLGLLLVGLLNCQDYPFEQRLPLRSQGHTVSQAVATVTPTDILFVVDNSGSMQAQRAELMNNVSNFITQMATSSDDFHVGVVTTDVECNLPNRAANCMDPNSTVSRACCGINQIGQNGAAPDCQEQKSANGNVIYSNCDGGRLRSLQGLPAYFSRPAASDQNQWISNVKQTISNLGCLGSSFESGFEAARRAIACSIGDPNCPDPKIAQLNAGFIRADADLVVVFVSDEDDCSFLSSSVYANPSDPTDTSLQSTHLCNPEECYAYYGKNDVDNNGVQTWVDDAYFQCNPGGAGSNNNPASPAVRSVNPPYPDDPNAYIDFLVAAKGGDLTKVRAAGIASAMPKTGALLGLAGDVCFNPGAGPTNACGCWSASSNVTAAGQFYCALTGSIGHASVPTPPNTVSNDCSPTASSVLLAGCKAMPAGRYVSFLESLSKRRVAASLSSDTLVDSICNASYSNTMYEIVNTIILTSCFQVNQTPPNVGSISVQLNGTSLTNVSVGSKTPGWSWVPGSSQICLEGGLKKTIGDTFNIFILEDVTPT